MSELNMKEQVNEQVIEIEPGKFELFRQIPDFSRYWINANATVVSIKNGKLKVRKQKIDKDGYCQISLYSDKNSIYKGKVKHFQVHRLVMMIFKPVDNIEKLEVDHIDLNRQNNCIDNLRYLTHAENCRRNKIQRKQVIRLTNEQKEYIKENYIPRDKMHGFKAMINKYNLSPQTLKNILYN